MQKHRLSLQIVVVGALITAPCWAHAQLAPDVATLSAEARSADIAVFRSQFLAKDRAYTLRARAEAEARLTALEAQARPLSRAYFELEIARIVALADNGHTASFAGPRSRRYNRVQVRVAPLAEGFYVLRAKERDADLLGAQLVAIDGHPIDELREVAQTLAGGTPAWRDRVANFLFESPEQLHALGLIAQPDQATYTFLRRNGETVSRQIPIDPPDEGRARANADRWFFPEPIAGVETPEQGWRSFLSEDTAPWALQDPDARFRWRRAPELRGIVMELRQTNDAPHQTIASALAEFDAALTSESPQNVVLDVRMNGGGDLNTTRAFMRALPGRVRGRIFVLTSPWTFSAAIASVGYLKQAAPERVTIVGEMVGDRLNFFAEGDFVTLPNSRAGVLNATERHDYQTGCRGFTDCHANIRRNPIAVATLAPDIEAPWTIDAYAAGRDPAIEAVAASLAHVSTSPRE